MERKASMFLMTWRMASAKLQMSVSAMFMVGGAFACECDADGSLDHYNCNSFGGQCQC